MKHLGVVLALVILNVLVFGQVPAFDFLEFDDDAYLVKNHNVQQGLTAESLKWALTTSYFANWHPLTWLSYLTEITLFGLNPAVFHVTNVLIHIAAGIILYFLLFRMTDVRGPSAIVALLFAIHPLHVESVAWISERKDVLCGLFWMLACYAYVSYTRRRTALRYGLVLLWFILGLMSKAMIVTLPFVFLLLDYWPLGRMKERAALRRLIVEKLPMIALSAAVAVMAIRAQHLAEAVMGDRLLSFPGRIVNAFSSYTIYVTKTFWPTNLSPFYPLQDVSLLWALASVAFVLGVSAFAVLGIRRYPYIFVGWFWYLGTLVPVIGLFQVGAQARADRYTYLPLIGLFIAVVWAAWSLVGTTDRRRLLVLRIGSACILLLTVVSALQVGYWRNTEILFRRALDVKEDNFLAHAKLGEVLRDASPGEAIEHSIRALELQPGYPYAHANLGMIYAHEGSIDKAIDHFTKALQPGPWLRKAHHDLATAYAIKGEMDLALEHYSEALNLDPDNTLALVGKGQVLLNQGRSEEAIQCFNRCLELYPENADAH